MKRDALWARIWSHTSESEPVLAQLPRMNDTLQDVFVELGKVLNVPATLRNDVWRPALCRGLQA